MTEHDHVVFGSLLHDIGKFFERAEILGEHCQNEDKRQQYCKTNENGPLGFFHALRTLGFCEALQEKVSVMKLSALQNPGQHWVELASCHHTFAADKEYYLKKIVQAADSFATAEREQGSFHDQGIHKRTRLESLLSRITLNNHIKEPTHFLPLTALSLETESIYPKTASQWDMTEVNKGNNKVWLAQPEALINDYKNMAEAFLNDLNHFPNVDQKSPQALRSIVRTLLALMEKYLSQVPAETNVLRPDISLFDHLRISAAIAEGLYDYHVDNRNLTTAEFKDQQISKWRLVCGDFSGIQNFIYKISSKGAAKGLRGRSFFIQLLCDAASEQLIRKLGLYATARIYSSGGKFYLLISETKLEALRQEVGIINQALLQQFRGEMCLSIGVAAIKADDFKEGNMGRGWKEANEDLMRNRLQPFAAQVAEDRSCFEPEALHEVGACQVCNRDDALADIQQEEDDEGATFRICCQCKDLRDMGRALADTHYLFWVWGEDRKLVNIPKSDYKHRIDLCGTDCTLYFLKKPPKFDPQIVLHDCHLESLNIIDPPNGNQQGYSTGFRFVGKWQREKTSGNYEFDHFAEQATNIKRMGVLRMDVDNLGEIFIRGLSFKTAAAGTETMGSLSRVATLSRQLHLFFAGYLATLLMEFPLCQIIYAGGDDVFIIGSWHELPVLAKKIRDEFKRYCADNDNFTLSGGIALATGKYPISKTAQAAGEAEAQAKQLKRGDKDKDALTFLDTAIGWESFDAAVQFKDDICELTKKTESHSLIDRLRQVVIATNELKEQLPMPTPDIIYWNKWRWRLIYNLKRMAQRDTEIERDLQKLQRQLLENTVTHNRQTVLDWLQMPVRWAEFLKRGNNND
ncbi:MAG: type III-A CRISPR-associated protein Cas10/Csm1 [Methylobacter sp.]|nr:type III-A CRISPR-associated protein Cas10/Csm1 [Methylobacter sp.]